MKTLLLIIGLLILSSGSSCLDSQTVLPGQLAQIMDATVVTCKPYAQTENDHQCLLIANPYQAAVRVFDVTDNQFVLSPIAYFPLVIQVGQAPNKIAVAGKRIFTLDPIDKKIYEIPDTFNSPVKQVFKLLDASHAAFALATGSGGHITSYESMPGDTNLIVTPDQKYLLRTNGSKLTIEDPQTAQPLFNIDFPVSIASITADSNRALVALTDKTLTVIELASGKEENTVRAQLDAVAAAVYLPSSLQGNPSKCCNGEDHWVGALLMDGTLQYWPYVDKTFKAPQKIDILLTTGVGSFTLTNPIKLLGATVQNPGQDGLGCERRLFLIYSGSIFNSCEGNSNIKRVDQMDTTRYL